MKMKTRSSLWGDFVGNPEIGQCFRDPSIFFFFFGAKKKHSSCPPNRFPSWDHRVTDAMIWWRLALQCLHDDVIKWKHFPRYWPFVRRIHRSLVNSPHKGQWRGAFMFSLISAWINGWVNNREVGDLRRHGPHYDVTVMVRRISHPDIIYDYICR